MKIAVSAKGNTMESQIDQRFGRAAFFIIVQTDDMEVEVVDNSAVAASGGAGISAAQMIADKDVEAVVTGNVGPNAMNVLKAAKIKLYKGSAESVKENVELFKKGHSSKRLVKRFLLILVWGPSNEDCCFKRQRRNRERQRFLQALLLPWKTANMLTAM